MEHYFTLQVAFSNLSHVCSKAQCAGMAEAQQIKTRVNSKVKFCIMGFTGMMDNLMSQMCSYARKYNS